MKKKLQLLGMGVSMVVLMSACGAEEKPDVEAVTEATETIADIDIEKVFDFNASDYVTLGEYTNLTVDKVKAEITQEDMDEQIMILQDENTEYIPVTDRPAQENDQVTVVYTQIVDGEEIAASEEEGDLLTIGDGYYGEVFEEAMIGMNIGEEKTFTEILSEEEYDESLAGKEAEYKVTLQGIDEVFVPEYNDALVAEATDFSTTEEFEEDMRASLFSQAEESWLSQAAMDAMGLAVENAEINGYPDTLYDACFEETFSYYQASADMFGMELDSFLNDFVGAGDEVIHQESELWANEVVVAMAIADAQKMDFSKQNFDALVETYAAAYGYDSAEEFISDNGVFNVYASVLLEEVGNKLLETASFHEITEAEYEAKQSEENTESSTEEMLEDTEVLLENTEYL